MDFIKSMFKLKSTYNTSTIHKIKTWTACHIDTKYKLVLLYQMLESLMINNIRKCYVSISFKKEFTKEEKLEILNHLSLCIRKLYGRYPDCYIITYFDIEREMTQFEHLDKLFRTYVGNKKSKIMFIDDDDILLSVPRDYKKYKIIAGKQYWPINTQEEDETYHKNFTEITKLLPEYESKWKKLTDFSGYMCRYKDLIKYFTEIRINELAMIKRINNEKLIKTFNSLEDIQFMKYLDMNDAHYFDEPFIFHRIWRTDDRPVQTWKKNMS